jgi:alpha-tubulin suppressor-like RCC1 family protein
VTVSLPLSATAVAASGFHTCALLGDGTVRCWGSNYFGQLGDGTTTDHTTPATVSGLSGATAVAAGVYHTCALLGDGTVKCWGQNISGQLGDGTTTNRRTPVTVSGLSGATAVAAGEYHTCALLGDGTVRCWGANWTGQLGDGTTTNRRTTPVTVSGLSSATAVAASREHTCALLGNGTVRCWGANWYGQLGNGDPIYATQPVVVVRTFFSVFIPISRRP